jgi:hypothetical protein
VAAAEATSSFIASLFLNRTHFTQFPTIFGSQLEGGANWIARLTFLSHHIISHQKWRLYISLSLKTENFGKLRFRTMMRFPKFLPLSTDLSPANYGTEEQEDPQIPSKCKF